MGRAEDLLKRLESGGETALDEMILSRTAEELFLDFKRSSDDGRGTPLSDRDRNHLATAISGFANSEGGVVIWGVDCSRDETGADVARAKLPIENIARFVGRLESAVSGCTIPPQSGVRSFAIATNDGKGFAVTFVPRSNTAPHQVVGRNQYFIRAGSSFVPAPHGVLAGLFGRRPQPYVFPAFTITPARILDGAVRLEVGIVIHNEGPGIARDVFANLLVRSLPGTACEGRFLPTAPNTFGGTVAFGREISMVSNEGVRLPPGAHLQPVAIQVDLRPPFSARFELEGLVGADGTPPYPIAFGSDPQRIESLVDELKATIASGRAGENYFHEIVQKLLGLPDGP
jgi:hypothetical protein